MFDGAVDTTAALSDNRRSGSTWARWHVVDDTGAPVGLIDEDRHWAGSRYGPPTYTAVHNPTGADWHAHWRSEGHPDVPTALTALQAHLDQGR